MSVVAIVPARSGSQRLPAKNRALVGGRSLVERAIEAALGARSVTEVVCSTDDVVLADQARELAARTVSRSPELATSTASTSDVVMEVIESIGVPDVVVVLQPTSPLRTSDDVERCVEALLADDSRTSVVTVCELDHPIEWTVDLEGGRLSPIRGWDAFTQRSQDLPVRYRLNGAVYAVRGPHFVATGRFVDEGSGSVVMPRERSVDVDTVEDLALCRSLHDLGARQDHS